MKLIKALGLLAIVFYLVGSFIEASFLIPHWRIETREYAGWIFIMVCLLSGMVYGMDQSSKEK